jgi:hypothetical protein
LGESDDLEEALAERGDANLVEGEKGLDGEDELGARDGAVDYERVFGGWERGGAKDTAPGVELKGGEHAVDGKPADLKRRDELLGVGLNVGRRSLRGGRGERGRLREKGCGDGEEAGGEAQANETGGHAKRCSKVGGAPDAQRVVRKEQASGVVNGRVL